MTPAQTVLISWAEKAPLTRNIILTVIGSIILAASAWIEVPMIPVPMTMQTFALLLIGALYGSRLAFATVCTYLFEGAIGLPVFSGGAGGFQHLIGPTAGYLVAFPFAAAFVGWCVEKNMTVNFYAMFGAMIISHAIVFAGGVAWLAHFVGLHAAIVGGFTPFIFGSLVKSALAVAVLQLPILRK
jgi:biotin transport system substrate-specific component